MKKHHFTVIPVWFILLSLVCIPLTAPAATSCPPHTWGEWITITEATCIQMGERVRYCQMCPTGFERETGYGDHRWGEWYDVHGERGLRERDCQVCGKQQFYYFPVPELTLTEISSPKNGSYYTEGETVTFTVRVDNKGAGYATGCEILLDDMKESCGTIEDYHSLIVSFDYTVTEDDVKAGSVTKQAILHCNEKKDALSGTVTVQTAKKEPLQSVKAVLTKAPDKAFVLPGDQVRVDYSVINTGETVVISSSSSVLDGNGKSISNYTFNDVPDNLPHLKNGESAPWSINYTITEEDINTGMLIRDVAFGCTSFVSMSDGHILSEAEYEHTDAVSGSQYFSSNTVHVEIPLETRKDPVQSAIAEIVAAPADFPAQAGEHIRVDYRVINTGESVIISSTSLVLDGKGKNIINYTFNDVPDNLPHLKNGESAPWSINYTITEDDIDAGVLIRDVAFGCTSFVSMSDGHILSEAEYEHMDSRSGSQYFFSSTARVIVPLEGKKPPEQIISGGSSISKQPEQISVPKRTVSGTGSCFINHTGPQTLLSFCTEHQAVRNQADAADHAAAKREIWQQALAAGYQEYAGYCSDAERAFLMAEQEQYNAFLDARERTLRQQYPDDPDAVDTVIARMLQNKVVGMCYEWHTVPGQLTGFSPDAAESGSDDMTDRLQNAYHAVSLLFPDDSGLFSAWLTAREALLQALWPHDAYTVQTALKQDMLNNILLLADIKLN